ncbi:1694_t:CDS:2 [Dentiscutata heterogama]|uniref:1694_t:CDS:1 n=1 Tax=Dentiscutata heterogama TaxID=1316150 RepID=A0ACA9JYS1_9GLOM|nr:1694_t:CDS:2 [Dentiscutata heterogama]
MNSKAFGHFWTLVIIYFTVTLAYSPKHLFSRIISGCNGTLPCTASCGSCITNITSCTFTDLFICNGDVTSTSCGTPPIQCHFNCGSTCNYTCTNCTYGGANGTTCTLLPARILNTFILIEF